MVTRQSSMADAASPPATPCAGQQAIVGLLLDTLQKLADAGEVDPACRIAGKACVIFRRRDPSTEHRFNALLHRLSHRLREAD